ncbi:MAG: ABC transporter permease [Chitinophagaceae bacterium]|nr:ABC transporter permease [Chitinophagaceae bacterium]
MLKNYLLIAWRNLKTNKVFSFINISGLAIGLATCLLILLYVKDELSFDRYNEKADRIYRVDGDLKFAGNHFVLAVAPEPMGAAMKKDYPEVEQEVRFRGYGGMLVRKGQQNIQEDKVVYTDSTLFSVFTFPMIQGDPAHALTEPRSVVITERTALKYFNSTDVVGKYLVVGDTTNLKVTGVIRDVPEQSHFNYDFFISLNKSMAHWEQGDWLSNNFNTYIVLKKGADARRLEARLPQMVNKYIVPVAQAVMHVDIDQFIKSGNYVKYSLMPLTDIHLHSNKTSEIGHNGNIQYVYIFSTIAVFILLIACINFMNLSTARSAGRAKEVGVRKVLGSTRQSLIRQFLMESMLICFIALVLAVLIAISLLPFFNQLASKQLTPELFGNPWVLASLLCLTVVVGFLAGSYPALFLSAFRPVQVLKGKIAAGFKSGWLRSTLVVFQFTISVVLMVGTIVIYRQLSYIHNKNIGYNREQVLIIQNTNALGSQATAFREEVLKMNGAESATMTGYLPTATWRNDYPLFPVPTTDGSKAASMQIWSVDENYIPTLDMQMVQGRNFSKDFLTDSTGIILNESAARLLGFREAVNKDLYSLDNFPAKDLTHLHVVGVVKDFNFNSLREQVSPLAMRWRRENSRIAIKTATKNIPGLITQIENRWKVMAPSQPFNYTFMDEEFNHTYRTEQQTGRLFISFATLAILIACMGLLGLAMFTAEQRTREIGIRKVLGASVGGILGLLTRDFLKLVVLSILVASPLAWWMMNKWLQDFAYRTSISWTVFAMATGAALVTAVVTISVQAIKSAKANPVKSLRTE